MKEYLLKLTENQAILLLLLLDDAEVEDEYNNQIKKIIKKIKELDL
jgi:hypothetical protein